LYERLKSASEAFAVRVVAAADRMSVIRMRVP